MPSTPRSSAVGLSSGPSAFHAQPGEVGAEISAAESRFERARRTSGLVLGPIAFGVAWFSPIAELSVEANRLMAVVALVVVWWITEAIPLPATALLGAGLTVLCGIATASQAFAPFASPTIFLFMGSFMIGQAIAEHRLDHRITLGLLRLPFLAGRVARMCAALTILTILLSGWMSNTATTVMMVPIAVGVLGAAGRSSSDSGKYGTGFLLSIAYAASIGGMMTPVGSPPNLITIGLLEQVAGARISFFGWMLLAVPIAVAQGAMLFIVGRRLFPLPTAGLRPAAPPPPMVATRWTRGQRNCAIAFGLAVVLWVAPGVAGLMDISGTPGVLLGRLDEGVVAILAAMLLFVLPVDWNQRRFTLDWPTAHRIDWGTILLFGGGLSLGQLMFSTGLAAYIGESAVRLSGAHTLWSITAIATLVGIVLTEFTSNTASTSMLVPVVLSICAATGLNPVPPSLGVCLGASLSFMLPISTPPNAVVYGTGMVPITSMMRFGIVMDLIGFAVVMSGLWILCPLLGYT